MDDTIETSLLKQANRFTREHKWEMALEIYLEVWRQGSYPRALLLDNIRYAYNKCDKANLKWEVAKAVSELGEMQAGERSTKVDLIPQTHYIHHANRSLGRRAAGIASIPVREMGLRRAIESLVHQIDEFHIYLNGYHDVPVWLKNISSAIIYRSAQFGELGDAGKFFGYARSDAEWYFSCDDDIVYPRDYAERLIAASQVYRAPVGVHGSILRYPDIGYYKKNSRHVLHFRWKNNVDRRVHILGTGTMLLNKKIIKALPHFGYPNMADIWMAKHMAELGIPMYAVARPDRWLKEIDVPGDSIYSANLEKETDQRLIVEREVTRIAHFGKYVKSIRKKVLVGIKTYNRLGYLRECVDSLCKTVCDERFEVVIAIADDGSNDGTREYLDSLSIPFEFHLIKNERSYVCRQFNSIIRLGEELNVDFYFILDDDVLFKKKGWMSGYFDAAIESGYHHLCHFNLPHFRQLCERTGEAFPPDRKLHKRHPLESHVSVRRAMGAFFTVSPEVVKRVGYADEVNFFVRGGWHVDFSARCCRAGFNEGERFWDLKDSNEFIELQNSRVSDYKSAISWQSEEFKRASTPQERKRRLAIQRMARRIHIPLELAVSGPRLDVDVERGGDPFTVNEVFERVYVINLDRRSDRMALMDKRLKDWGIAYRRFSAIDGANSDVKELYNRYLATRPKPSPDARMSSREFFFGNRTDAERTAHIEAAVKGPAIRSAGAFAYLLTYRNILRECIKDGLETVLILDDDCLFHKRFATLFSAAYSELPRSWRLFQLGSMQYNWSMTEDYSDHLYLPHGVLVASHAVGLQRETYAMLLDGISRMTLPFDIGPLQDCARAFDDMSFVCKPNLIIQDQAESDINSSDVAKIESEKAQNIYRWNLADYQ